MREVMSTVYPYSRERTTEGLLLYLSEQPKAYYYISWDQKRAFSLPVKLPQRLRSIFLATSPRGRFSPSETTIDNS